MKIVVPCVSRGDSEVGYFDLLEGFGDEQVGGFDVAVEETFCVDIAEGVEDRHLYPVHRWPVELSAVVMESVGGELQDEIGATCEEHALRGLFDVCGEATVIVEADDTWVMKGGHEACFFAEGVGVWGRAKICVVGDLDRDLFTGVLVLSTPHL